MDDSTEVWATYPERPLYSVSNMGRVRGPLRVLKPRISKKDGYERLILAPKPFLTRTTHSMVALTFLGPRPPSLIVAHKNGVRHDNRLSNLQYTTQRANNIHSRSRPGFIPNAVCPLLLIENGSRKIDKDPSEARGKARGERSGRCKVLSDAIVARIHEEYAKEPNANKVDRILGLPPLTSAAVVAGRRWRHLHPDPAIRR